MHRPHWGTVWTGPVRRPDLDRTLLYIGEIDARELYLERAYPSMILFCMKELGFSEGAAYYRVFVARAARRVPAMLEALRSGAVHLAGLRVLAPHLNDLNQRQVLAQAAGKSKREIEEIAAALAPKSPVPDSIRNAPVRTAAQAPTFELLGPDRAPTPVLPPSVPIASTLAPPYQPERRQEIVPLSADTFHVHFTASRNVRDKIREAQDLLRHRVPNGSLEQVFDKALDALILNLKKERFAVGRKARKEAPESPPVSDSREIPDAIKRAVFERDGGRCAYIDENGTRCPETGGLEFDHLDGWARTRVHDLKRIRLACRAHNAHAAAQLYGRAFMERMRNRRSTCPGDPGASDECPAPQRGVDGTLSLPF